MFDQTEIKKEITLSELMKVLDNPDENSNQDGPKKLLRECVEMVMQSYFEDLGNAPGSNIYGMVTQEVEIPLIKTVLRYTRFNRLKAAKLLGISRTTFHKKLKIYGLDLWLEKEKRIPLA